MKRINVWAHRGASGYAPENTIEAIKMAADMGADGIELDVQLTKDGHIVVIHDETIDRVSDGVGFVKDYTLEELKSFNFCNNIDGYDDVKIPTLKEVYEFVKTTNMVVNVELKTGVFFYEGMVEDVFKLTKDMGMKDRVIYSSFNHYTILKVKELDNEAMTGFLYSDGIIDMPSYASKYEVNALHPATYNLQYEGFMEECIKRDIDVNVWTVNSDEDISLAINKGVTSIITNYPDKVIKILNDMNKR